MAFFSILPNTIQTIPTMTFLIEIELIRDLNDPRKKPRQERNKERKKMVDLSKIAHTRHNNLINDNLNVVEKVFVNQFRFNQSINKLAIYLTLLSISPKRGVRPEKKQLNYDFLHETRYSSSPSNPF